RENPAWGPKLLLGRKTWIHTVAHAGLSAPKVPDWQEIRSTPCVDGALGMRFFALHRNKTAEKAGLK
ncbi:hypothetical protein ACJ6WH_18660, partial [Stenotrophomonas maltophilia]|uniref:hypothetical protein n=1 Tax=Stenotrophomonas maltophilia TaxID=40324 RepID=UPI0038968945